MIVPDAIEIELPSSDDDSLPDFPPSGPKGKAKAASGSTRSAPTKKRPSDAASADDEDTNGSKRAKVSTRSQNWTDEETDALLRAIKRVLPTGQTEWNRVVDIHAQWSTEQSRRVRDRAGLQRRYKKLVATKPSTGDPNIPPYVLEAKRLENAIFSKNDIVILDDDVKPKVKSETKPDVKPKVKLETKLDVKPTVAPGKAIRANPASTSSTADHDLDDDDIVEVDSKGKKKLVVSHKLATMKSSGKSEAPSSSRQRKGKELTASLANFLDPQETAKRQEQRASLASGLMVEDRIRRLEERLADSERARTVAETENKILTSYLTTGGGWGPGSAMLRGLGGGGASGSGLAHMGGGMVGSSSGGGYGMRGTGGSGMMGGGRDTGGHFNWESNSAASPATGVRFQQQSADVFDFTAGSDGDNAWFLVSPSRTIISGTHLAATKQTPSTPARRSSPPSWTTLPCDNPDTHPIPGTPLPDADVANGTRNIGVHFGTRTPAQDMPTNSLTISITPTKRNTITALLN